MPTRKRTYNVRLIRATWPYTIQEIAELFGIHKNAITRWLNEGLAADTTQRPYLIRGDELIRFLSARQTAKTCRCGLTEFFCFRCRTRREAALKMADIVIESAHRFRVKALCAECSTPVNKMQGITNLPRIEASFEVMTLVGRHLIERSHPSLNRDKDGKS